MARNSWWRRFRDRVKTKKSKELGLDARPLREFVYLDEVSLTSLLVSQKDTILEQVTSGGSASEEAELSATGSVDVVAAKVESATRYTTSNSSSIESSRKAVVQTLFNELRDDERVPISLNDGATGPSLIPCEGTSLDGQVHGWPIEELRRGDLIEVEVVLEVDPVFRLGTMVSEFSAMAAEYPQMAGASGIAMLNEIEPVKKVLDRLMAGLIPIRARACNFAVVAVQGKEYVVPSGAAAQLGVAEVPLTIVGVTEHIGYWKDIRRVLFSSGQFKLLCRVARPGLHEKWTPVKVAHVFEEIAPTLAEQIDAFSRLGLSGTAAGSTEALTLLKGLVAYAGEIASSDTDGFHDVGTAELVEIAELVSDVASPSAQRQAFAQVRELIEERNPGYSIDETRDLAARQRARLKAGLPTFPGEIAESSSGEAEISSPPDTDLDAKLLDVEVVAIYW